MPVVLVVEGGPRGEVPEELSWAEESAQRAERRARGGARGKEKALRPWMVLAQCLGGDTIP